MNITIISCQHKIIREPISPICFLENFVFRETIFAYPVDQKLVYFILMVLKQKGLNAKLK